MKTKTFINPPGLAKQLYLWVLPLFIAACACTKNVKEQLPPITKTGANTFGCLIDGKVFIPKDHVGWSPPGGGRGGKINIDGGYNFNKTKGDDYWIIDATDYKTIYIYIYIPSLKKAPSVYTFGKSSGHYDGRKVIESEYPHAWLKIKKNEEKYLSIKDQGSVTITRFDFDEGIYSGIFSFKAVNKENPTDIISVTEGRFDIDLGTLNQD